MFNTNPVLLKSLLSQVEAGKIQLPDFQRGWIWDDGRIRGLLASISKGFPVGAVMSLSAGSDIKFRSRPIEGAEQSASASPDSFLLDGQQRLTTLYQSLIHPKAVNTSDSKRQKVNRWYYIDMRASLEPNTDREDAILSVPENRKTTTDFGRTVVTDLSTPELEYEQHMMPTECLLDPTDWMLGYFKFWENSEKPHPEGSSVDFFKRFKEEVQSNFDSYQLPVISLTNDTPKEAVCLVFEKVNTGGVTLNVFELATASFAADAESFSLRDDWEERRKRLYASYGVLRGIEGDQFLQTVALLKTQEDRRRALREGKSGPQAPAIGCKKRDILNLELKDYQHWADKVERGFLEAGKFLRTQYVFGKRNVPYNTQLVPLAALHVELGDDLETAFARERLERWYWSGVFGEIYGGTVETQFALDLVEVAEFVRRGTLPRLINEATFVPERLVTLRSRVSAAYKGVYALQMKNGAADWITAEPLTIANYDNEHIDIHHIFPVAWCERKDEGEHKPRVSRRLYDSVINKTPIDATTNRKIGGRPPSEYLKRIQQGISPDRLVRVLEAHWLDYDVLASNDFGKIFVDRGEAMLELIGRAMGRNLGSGQEVFKNALVSEGYSSLYIEDESDYDESVESESEEDDLQAIA